MMCDGVYQSAMCWELSALITSGAHSLTVPQVQIGTRPMASRIAAVAATRPRPSRRVMRPAGRTVLKDPSTMHAVLARPKRCEAFADGGTMRRFRHGGPDHANELFIDSSLSVIPGAAQHGVVRR